MSNIQNIIFNNYNNINNFNNVLQLNNNNNLNLQINLNINNHTTINNITTNEKAQNDEIKRNDCLSSLNYVHNLNKVSSKINVKLNNKREENPLSIDWDLNEASISENVKAYTPYANDKYVNKHKGIYDYIKYNYSDGDINLSSDEEFDHIKIKNSNFRFNSNTKMKNISKKIFKKFNDNSNKLTKKLNSNIYKSESSEDSFELEYKLKSFLRSKSMKNLLKTNNFKELYFKCDDLNCNFTSREEGVNKLKKTTTKVKLK